jgi:catalase-peroxidase
MENNTNNDQDKCPVNHGQTPTDGTTIVEGNHSAAAGKCPVMHGSNTSNQSCKSWWPNA